MNVLSLFDGMSCGQIALNRLGVKPDKYYAAEIDKAAIQVTKKNYPDTVHLGDVTKWLEWDIDWASIDLVIAGSPCQGFSYAGKQLAFDDPRSALFFTFLGILQVVKYFNPDVKFMLENVKMKKEHLDVITEQLGVKPEFINSRDYSACERPRHYWFNWDFNHLPSMPKKFGEIIDYGTEENTMSDGWHEWWKNNREFQLRKSYSKKVGPGEQGITMTARQYASWNGNFIPTPAGKYRKPTRQELALLCGAPPEYFDSVSQRRAEEMTGNGWTVDVVAHILAQGVL